MNSPAEIARLYLNVGKAKTGLPVHKTLLLAFLAGCFIAVGGIASTTAAVGVTAPGLAKLVSGAVFPVGLAMVLIAGSELFTGNSLLIIPILQKEITAGSMVKNWALVWIGNLVGGIFIAWLVVYSGVAGAFDGQLAHNIMNTAIAKCSLGFGEAFLRGVGCNFLVCIAVWMAFAAKDVAGKIAGLFFPIMAFVVIGFEHSVANMYYIPAGIFAHARYGGQGLNFDALAWGNFFGRNLLPVTLGNLVGGVIFVGVIYWICYGRQEQAPGKDR